MMLFIYRFFFPFVFPFFLPGLIWKLIRRPGHKASYWERFGIYSNEKKLQLREYQGGIWLHAVSVGETNLALTVLNKWVKMAPDQKFILSTTTTTGQEIARNKCPENVIVIFCPIDLTAFVRTALNLIKPSALVIFETELWPNLIAEARNRQIPTALVNARMSDHSAKGYRKFKMFFAPLLRQLNLVAAQSEADLQRYLDLAPGITAVNTGNLKFDQQVPENLTALDTAHWFGKVPQTLIAAASTHPGEEALIARTFKDLLAEFPDAGLVIVPRHAERGGEVEEILNSLALPCCRKSTGNPPAAPVQVLLADTTGEMLSIMKAADIVIMGKSLAGQDEGHNLIEPALLDKPIVTGAVLKNFRFVQQVLRDADALAEVHADPELATVLARLLRNADERTELGRRGGEAIRKNAGAINRTLDLLDNLK